MKTAKSTPTDAGGDHGDSGPAQPIIEHLRDLRSCLVVSVVAVCVCFMIVWGGVESISRWFFAPLIRVLPEGTSLIFTSYQEGFFFI